jgi:GNAT superfamily N-acetyltransferase
MAMAEQLRDDTSGDLLGIERAAVKAWPAEETADIDGWVWRYTGGGSLRANSVSALGFAGRDIDAAIAEVEWRYRARRAPIIFQMSPERMPSDLDERLAHCGYRRREPCTTLAKAIDPKVTLPSDVVITDTPTKAWLHIYLAGISPDRRKIAPTILERVPGPKAFVLATRDGEPVSTALGVIDGKVVIAECVSTRADRRRSGNGSTVMRGIEAWGALHGATLIGLQAVSANKPAQAMYAALGYAKIGEHHYRVLDT